VKLPERLEPWAIGLIPLLAWVGYELVCGALGVGVWLVILVGLLGLLEWGTKVATRWSYRTSDANTEPPKAPSGKGRWLTIVEDEKVDD
jgi:hypothetical protein